MAEWCKAFTVYSHPSFWSVDSNPNRGMGYICDFSFVVVLWWAHSAFTKSHRMSKIDSKLQIKPEL
jgi:hypothetical protein